MSERYSQQIKLSEIGVEGQEVLSRSKVLIVGAGGLCSPVVQYLVGAGVSTISIVDSDVVSLTNLHRQTLFGTQNIGDYKVDIIKKKMRDLNPNVLISAYRETLTPDNVHKLSQGADLVLDCADNFATSYILSDYCLENNTPLVSAAASQFSGHVGAYCKNAPSLRAVFPSIPNQVESCEVAGVVGPLVGLIGSMQAQVSLSVLLCLEPRVMGQVIFFDIKNFRFSKFSFVGTAEPKLAPKFISTTNISDNDFVADLRSKDESRTLVSKNAVRLSVESFTDKGPRPEINQRAVFCCKSGVRAWRAATKLRKFWNGEIVLLAINK